jgi:uncharacterized membrane protein YgcG
MRFWKDFNRRFLIAGILLSAILGFGRVSYANAETIDNFYVQIGVKSDGSASVSETITYNFGTNQKHGIFRDIPLTAKDGPTLVIDVLGVADESGQPYQYTESTANNILDIKIGDPSVLISGIKTYVIDYRVYNAMRTFPDHDELYWNATGNRWSVRITQASASVTWPIPTTASSTTACFTGVQGSMDKNCISSGAGNIANYSASQSLGVGEGLTIVAGVPRGYINNVYVAPPAGNSSGASGGSALLIPLFVFIMIGFSIFAKVLFAIRSGGTKPKPVIPRELKGRPVVVEYNSPDNLPPIEIGTLLDRRVDITDISSVIMDLAVRGYLKIRYTVEVIKFFPDKKDFELIKLKDGADLAHPADKTIFAMLFSGRDSIKLSDLQQTKTVFQGAIKEIKETVEGRMFEEGYFDKEAKENAKKMSGWGLTLFMGLFVLSILDVPFAFSVPVLISALSLMIAGGKLNNKLTAQGVTTLGKILGFREFLQLTEKDKLALLNAPELKPEIFEKFLAYAMVLGVEDKWAAKFEGIYNATPNWYEDPTATRFSSVMLANNLILFNSSFNQVFNITSPRSSSGFSGGSSGGGSGGGGGGSW